jgi:hypothetical protein
MLSLCTATFPSSACDLERLLNQSLQRIFSVDVDPVSIHDTSYSHLEEIRVSLDGASLRSDPPKPAFISGKTSPALRVDRLSVSARALSVGPATIDLSLSAHTVNFVQGKDSADQVVLSLENAADGKMEISIAQANLETLITKLVQNQASKQGVMIDGVQLNLRQGSAHSLAAEVNLRARKLFLSASIRVTGQLDLDDQLNLKVFGLNCTGDGGMATLACGVLTPYLRKIDGREFPLMSLPLGEVHLRDVRLVVDENLTVTAKFGSGKAA